MILILSSADDQHADAVSREITALGGHPVLLDLSSVPTDRRISWHLAHGERSFRLAGRPPIDLGDARVIWWRRPQPPRLDASITDPEYRQFAHTETYEAMAGMWSSLDARWINPPHQDERAHRKVYQLRVAQDVGLEVPETLVTSDPDAAHEFISRHGIGGVIYKAFSATQALWRETRLVKADEVDLIDNVKYAPVIFQRFVPSAYDLRITVVGSELFPAAIHAQETAYKVDMRMDIANAQMTPSELPDDVRDRLLELMRRLGLVYGAIDVLRTHDGRYVFLEINPAGQFLFIEERTRQPIARAMAALMVDWAAA